jgi:hypothetical protein
VTTQPQPGPPEAPTQLRPVRPLSLATSQGGGSGSSPVLRIIAAAVFVLLVIGAYVYFNEKPPVVAGEILHLTAYPIHSESKANQFATQSIAPVETKFDEVIIIADVRLHNQSEGPVFLADMAATLKLPTEEDRSLAAGTADFNRVFVAYPALAPMKQQPLLRDITIPAGATTEGQLVYNYPITKEQWDQRQSLTLTLSFTHQKDLVLLAPQ